MTVEVFVVFESGHHHGGVVEIGSLHDDGVEISHAIGESLAVIFFDPRLRELGSHFCEFASVHISEAGPLDVWMILQPVAFELSDSPDSDLEDSQATILVGLSAGSGAECGDSGEQDGSVREEGAAGDGGV